MLSRERDLSRRPRLLSLERALSRTCRLPKTSCQSVGSLSIGVGLNVGLPLGGTPGSAALGPLGASAGGEGALLLVAVGLAFDFGLSSLSRDFDLSLLTELGDA